LRHALLWQDFSRSIDAVICVTVLERTITPVTSVPALVAACALDSSSAGGFFT
jgi:hypothetical protein